MTHTPSPRFRGSRRMVPGTAAAVLLLCAACPGSKEIGGRDTADQRPPDGRTAALEKSVADRRVETGGTPDKAMKQDSGGCSPLPERCLCAQACQAGKCDNSKCTCATIPGVSYSKIGSINPYGGDMSKHVDVNLLLRKWRKVNAQKGLISCSGTPDYTPSPQLYSLFVDERVPLFADLLQIDNWDWSCNCSKGYVTDPEATLAYFTVKPGEVIQTPFSGYTIMPPDYGAMVLYAAPGTITIKYTPEDSVVLGYTIHIFGICVEPSLLALYKQCNTAGRKQLPGLKKRQPLGRALTSRLLVAIRDTGSWMEPRCRLGWWIGK